MASPCSRASLVPACPALGEARRGQTIPNGSLGDKDVWKRDCPSKTGVQPPEKGAGRGQASGGQPHRAWCLHFFLGEWKHVPLQGGRETKGRNKKLSLLSCKHNV
ncbi:Transient Receptor Potential Cation Channel Subfamily V Member 4 [Manis pentadactyla]|nr:Transient Receptor Potential Cation Channel Subfamily V Member 4 [Manis pentadactyla]